MVMAPHETQVGAMKKRFAEIDQCQKVSKNSRPTIFSDEDKCPMTFRSFSAHIPIVFPAYSSFSDALNGLPFLLSGIHFFRVARNGLPFFAAVRHRLFEGCPQRFAIVGGGHGNERLRLADLQTM